MLKKAFKVFHSYSRCFKDAVMENNAAEVARLLNVHIPDDDLIILLVEQASQEVLKVYFQKVADKGREYTFLPIKHCLKDGPLLDRVDVLLEAGIDFNRGQYKDHPITDLILCCPAGRERRLQWLEKMTAGGIEKIAEKERFMKLAAGCCFPEAVDLFVRLGLDPRANEEQALRKAALCQGGAMCRHLIEKHGADMEQAIMITRRNTNFIDLSTDEMNDELKTLVFLGELQSTLKQPAPRKKPVEEAKPATIETLSEDLKKLRDMVAELTQKVVQLQNPVVRLDKNSNSTPKV